MLAIGTEPFVRVHDVSSNEQPGAAQARHSLRLPGLTVTTPRSPVRRLHPRSENPTERAPATARAHGGSLMAERQTSITWRVTSPCNATIMRASHEATASAPIPRPKSRAGL